MKSKNDRGIILRVKFIENLYSQYIRRKQFNEVDFLSFVGGLLGLFAGFSALSFIELIYWFPIRLIAEFFKRTPTRVFPFNQVLRRNQRKVQFLLEFLENSSIHGANYFRDTKLFDK